MKKPFLSIILSCIVILLWIPITYFYQVVFYDTSNVKTIADALAYYGIHKGYFGLDHGVKSICYLILSLFPIVIFMKTSARFENMKSLQDILFTGLGMLSFILISVSLMVQAFAAEKLITLYNSVEEYREIYLNLFEFLITNGVMSYSIYIISYTIYFIWILFTVRDLKQTHKQSANLLIISGVLSVLSALTIFLKHLLGINILEISSITDLFNVIVILIIVIGFSRKEKIA